MTHLTLGRLLLMIAFTLSQVKADAQIQGAELLKTDILSVLAHPDDETGMASTLAYYAHQRDTKLAHVYCTRGEGGGNMAGTHWGRSLGVLREIELQQCLDTLGVKHHFFLEQLDWAYTESAAMTLEKWDRSAALEHLVRLIRNLRPEVMLTMNPFPRPGQHGHHQAAGILAVEAYTAAGDPNQFPEQLTREGLTTWQTRKLYFRGDSTGAVAKVDPGSDAHTIAGNALRNHRSQGFGRFQRTTIGRPPEAFGLIYTAIPTAVGETDLLAGLTLSEDEQPRVIQAPQTHPSGLQANFKPRPALTRFRSWAKEQKIDHLMGDFPSDLPVVAGQATRVLLDLKNHTAASKQAAVRFEIPDGWTIQPETLTTEIPSLGQREISLSITSPSNATEDVSIKAMIDDTQAAEIGLHPVPHTHIKAFSSKPSLDGTVAGWGDAPAIAIAPTQLVQGKADNAEDLSAEVRTGYDTEFLYVDVLVQDETLVTNIAPNDIRGHWRTDAVEICIDPTASSEHTLTCFKAGIFPFDLEGNTRAARDADALQGPIEETAPGMIAKAIRTGEGYRIQTAIPWKAIGLETPKRGQTIGFNIILYDGDKKDAAIGENINVCRLAWAPRSGVQGRPEDWGRLTLD